VAITACPSSSARPLSALRRYQAGRSIWQFLEGEATLASILRKARHGVRLNEHLEHDCGLTVFQHPCRMGLEGIVSKRLGSRYCSGRSPDWLKFKNPAAPAVRREAEDWGKRS
jgi:hypothetical protein